jgi:hypothetical protein
MNISTDIVINSVEIISLNGQVLTTAVFNANQGRINISNLTQGVYVVRISTTNGISTSKLVIE